jgi:hypothetical protein
MKRHQEIALGADEDVQGNLLKGFITKFEPVPGIATNNTSAASSPATW